MLVVACVLTAFPAAAADAVLSEADVTITVTAPMSCEVTMALTVDGAREIDHRVEIFDGGRVELVDTRGARRSGDVRSIGRTQSLVLRPDQASYELRYRVWLYGDRAARCPIWLPAVPTDGRSRAVSIRVQLPPGATPGRSMPAFDWTGTQGSTRLGHLPAFVHVPYVPQGESPVWSIGQEMDVVALLVFGAATAVWIWRRRR